VNPALFLAVAFGSATLADFRRDFPGASTLVSPEGGHLIHASGFEATGLGGTPEAAARAFLTKYGAAFGIGAEQELAVRNAPPAGQPGPVRFERRIDGLPIFDSEVVVGIDGRRAVILLNTGDVPAQVTGIARISRMTAIRDAKSAIPGLEKTGGSRAKRGWRTAGDVLRPVWRVDFSAARPPGDWRSYVDAETGEVLLRVDRRARATVPGVVSPRSGLTRPVAPP
jgi:Zn-dependent metalloprotease